MDSLFYSVSSLSSFADECELFSLIIVNLFSLGGFNTKPVSPFICILVVALACFLVRKIIAAIRG